MQHAEQTVTYYEIGKEGQADRRTVLNGVSWHCKTVVSSTEKGAVLSRVAICRIPAERVPEDFQPRQGDMLVPGICEAYGISDAVLKHRYAAVTVKALSDNRGGLAPHWKLEAV